MWTGCEVECTWYHAQTYSIDVDLDIHIHVYAQIQAFHVHIITLTHSFTSTFTLIHSFIEAPLYPSSILQREPLHQITLQPLHHHVQPKCYATLKPRCRALTVSTPNRNSPPPTPPPAASAALESNKSANCVTMDWVDARAPNERRGRARSVLRAPSAKG